MMMKTILFLLLSIPQGVVYSWWNVQTPQNIMASDGSCVRIPCTFNHPAQYKLTEVKWLKDNKTHGTLVIDSKKQSDPQFQYRAELNPQWEAEKDCTLTITDMTHRDVGPYYFRMENNNGGKYSNLNGVLLNVSDVSNLPIISSPKEIVEGTEVILTCSVRYGCPGHLTWIGTDQLAEQTSTESQSTDLNGATTSLTLRFVASYRDHGRTLSCEQTSSLGKAPSQSITLDVKFAPRFAHLTLSPFKTIGFGDSVTLECVVGDSNPPVTSYRWSRGADSETSVTSRRTYQTHSQTYSAYTDMEYGCEAINSVGKATSDRTKLPVYGNDKWAVWTPLSLHAREGSCVIIPCLFHIPQNNWRYQTDIGIWFKDFYYKGTPVFHTSNGTGGNYTGRVEFLGNMKGENCSLKIGNLKESDGGKYHFRIEASAGKWSDQIGLTLLISRRVERPEIEVPDRVLEGEAISLTCSVHTYCPDDTPVFEWHLPGFNVPQVTGNVFQAFKDYHWIYSHTVVYTPTFENSHQTVKCAANFGSQTPSQETEISLDVKYRPRNVTISLSVNGQTHTQNIKERDRVVLSCDSASAHPAVNKYTWYRDETEVQREWSGSLQFPKISYTDYGTYVCQASNEVGSSRSAGFTVTGKARPLDVHIEYHINGKQTRQPAAMRENDQLTLTCVSTNSDPPVSSYSWLQNGWIENNQNQEMRFDRISRQEDGKRYQCQAHNEIGTGISETITIHVQYAPTNVRITYLDVPVVGRFTTLWCDSDANPALRYYSWRKMCGSLSVNLKCYSRDCRLRIPWADISCDYYCTVRNSIGERESPPKRINVQSTPTNVRITSPAGAPVGQSITLWCESDVNPAPRYDNSWRKVCGSQSSNPTGNYRKYAFYVKLDDASCDFYCTVNSIGDQESPPKYQNVEYEPKDVKILSSDSVVEGSQVTLRCESVGNPPANTYQWKKVCSGMDISLEGSTRELRIQVSAEDESCAYYCRAGNSIGGQDSEPKRFHVHYGPRVTKIKSSESSGRIREGKSLTLTCETKAKPPAQFSWYRDPKTNLALPSGGQQLTFNSVNSSDSGNYFCGATNEIGSDHSGFFLLDVLYGPRKTKISASAPPEQVREGDNISLTCRSDSNPPISSYQWYRSNGVTNTTVGSTSSYLHLVRITQQHDGVYYCVATADSRSQVSEGIRIRVSYGPRDTKIKSSESSGQIREGKSLTLTCETKAKPPAQFSWYRDPRTNVALPSGGQQLTFKPVSSSDSGNYFCGATNGIGSDHSGFFLLDVLYGPRKTKISASAPPEQVREGDNISLTCQSDSNPPISSYQWYQSNGVTNTTVGSTSSYLHLVRITQQHDGVYHCVATADSRRQVSEGIRIRVSWSKSKKVAITITPIIIVILIISIVGFLYFTYRKKRLDSFRQWSTDATNVVYSVVNKSKPKETLVYENMVVTENARSHGQSTQDEGIHASVTFRHGSNQNTSDSYAELAWPSGSKDAKTKAQGEPSVIYSQVCVRPRTAKDTEDYENVGHLGNLDEDESDEEVSYTTVVFPQPSRSGPIRRPSEDSIQYTNLVT